MDVYFLTADVRLTKSFTPSDVSPYPLAKNFTSLREQINSIAGLYAALQDHAQAGNSLLKGIAHRDLVRESRAGATVPTDSTEWICFDIDRALQGSVEEVIQEYLPEECRDVSYVVQYSATYVARGPVGGLSAHVYMLLDRPYPAALLREWLRWINITTLRDQLVLNPAGTTLKYKIDPSVAQNDKLIYIAPPICKGFEPIHPQHMQLVQKGKPRLEPKLDHLNPAKIDEQVQALVNELRKAEGLKARTIKMKGDVQINPDRAARWEMKSERGFVYFNLNGGNSWGYYHPAENPEVIYNFKGEPPYLTKALLPDYWATILQQERAKETGLVYFVYRDIRSAGYYNGWYDKGKNEVTVFSARSKEQLHDFLAQRGYTKPDYIQDFNVVFDPKNNKVFSAEEKFVNLYQPSKYMMNAGKPEKLEMPPTIERLIHHVCGNSAVMVEHFLNWLAVIVQHKQMAETAWVLHGTQGTGKGVLVNYILSPIIGKEYVKIVTLSMLEEQFNPWLEKCILLVLDEASIEDAKQSGKLMAKLKGWITEPTVTIRAMHTHPYQVTSRVNLLVTTNMHDPVVIHHNDRRFNVATRQLEAIQLSAHEFNKIADELQDFTNYLMYREADIALARTIIDTPDREQIKELTQTSLAVTSRKFLEGDVEFFMLNAPPPTAMPNPVTFNGMTIDVNGHYIEVMRKIIRDKKDVKLSRVDLFVLFEHTVGNCPVSPNKLTSMFKHHDINLKRMRIDGGEPEYGVELTFKVKDEHHSWIATRVNNKGLKLVPPSPPPPRKEPDKPKESEEPTEPV